MQRIAQIIKINPEKKDLYIQLHANPWKAVNQTIKDCNIQNYSIYLYDEYLFSYFEYTGTDFDADMKKMAENKETQIWWELTKPCQLKIPGTPKDVQWLNIKEVFHLD